MKKIDIHCHTTNRKVERIVSKDCTLQTIAEEMRKYDVTKTVLLATYFPKLGTGISNFRLASWIRGYYDWKHQQWLNKIDKSGSGLGEVIPSQYPEFLMFGSLDFEHYFYQGYNELEELGKQKFIAGIKLYTCYQNIDFSSEKFKKLINLAQKNKWPVMCHLGYTNDRSPESVRKVIPNQLEFIAEREQPLIISHLSKPLINELIETVKKHETIYSDMSGLFHSYDERAEIPKAIENIKKFVGECGPEKLLFGTDFPVQTHEDSIFLIETAMKNYSEEDKKKVYYDNSFLLLNRGVKNE